MLRKSLLFIAVLLIAGLGCSSLSLLAAPTEAPAILPPPPEPTAEICSANPPGLAIQILFERRDPEGQQVTLNGIGFTPGEKLTLRIHGQGVEHGFTVETTDFVVSADGTFSNVESLPLDDPAMHWEAHVVHKRGIACLSFDTNK